MPVKPPRQIKRNLQPAFKARVASCMYHDRFHRRFLALAAAWVSRLHVVIVHRFRSQLLIDIKSRQSAFNVGFSMSAMLAGARSWPKRAALGRENHGRI
jgi:hypothetical protein